MNPKNKKKGSNNILKASELDERKTVESLIHI